MVRVNTVLLMTLTLAIVTGYSLAVRVRATIGAELVVVLRCCIAGRYSIQIVYLLSLSLLTLVNCRVRAGA